MNETVKTAWCARLRSGTVKQGKGALRVGDAFCCLGVLCELAVEAGVVPPPAHVAGTTWLYGVDDDANDMVLPGAVADWAGLNDTNPCVGNWKLADYNDGVEDDDREYKHSPDYDPNDDDDYDLRSHTFAEIADLIEKNL